MIILICATQQNESIDYFVMKNLSEIVIMLAILLLDNVKRSDKIEELKDKITADK